MREAERRRRILDGTVDDGWEEDHSSASLVYTFLYSQGDAVFMTKRKRARCQTCSSRRSQNVLGSQ